MYKNSSIWEWGEMTKKTLNVLMIIMATFFVLFFGGSIAYENYLRTKSDEQYEEQWKKEQAEKENENASGSTINGKN